MRDDSFYILSMVTDLRRASYCLAQKDKENADVFLNHSKKIYVENLHTVERDFAKKLFVEFNNLYKEKDERYIKPMLFADKLMTLSSRLQFCLIDN